MRLNYCIKKQKQTIPPQKKKTLSTCLQSDKTQKQKAGQHPWELYLVPPGNFSLVTMDLLTIILPFDPWCSNLGSLSISSTGNTNHKSGDLLYAWTVHSDCHLNYTNKVSEKDIINLGIWLFIRAIKYQAHHHKNVMVGHLLYLIFIPFRKSLINLLSKTA